jgi:hypothetical protein
MNYAVGCAFNLDEMFINLDKKKLKMTSNLCEQLTNDRHRNTLIKRIFLESVKLVLDDIIDNNVTFELPTGGRRTIMRMNRIKDKEFAKARRNGKFKEVDFLTSNFSGYEIVLELFHTDGRPERKKHVYVDKVRKNRIIEHTNNGK